VVQKSGGKAKDKGHPLNTAFSTTWKALEPAEGWDFLLGNSTQPYSK
jgi:hypothetical protein